VRRIPDGIFVRVDFLKPTPRLHVVSCSPCLPERYAAERATIAAESPFAASAWISSRRWETLPAFMASNSFLVPAKSIT
jgi:hypothetical protein